MPRPGYAPIVGTLYYGDSGTPIGLEDNALAHLKVAITTDYGVAQVGLAAPGVVYGAAAPARARTVVVPEARIDVSEPEMQSVSLAGNSTVADLVRALARIKTSPRDMISILQGMKTAGALNAEPGWTGLSSGDPAVTGCLR